jgi:hypothetical protein
MKSVVSSFIKKYYPELLLFCVVIYQFAGIYVYTIDTIFIDEWDYLYPGRLDSKLNLGWLVSFYNEHRILPTKLLAWINYNLNGLNFRYLAAQSYLVYVFYIGALYFLKILTHGRDEFRIFPIFLALLLSSSNYWNLFYGFQSCFHFVLLNCCVFLIWIYRPQKSFVLQMLIAGSLILLISFSLGTGVAMSIALTAGFLLINSLLKSSKKLLPLLLFGFSVLVAVLTAAGVKATQELTMPYQWQFWHYLFQLMGASLGFDSHYRALPIGIFVSIFLIVGFVFIYQKNSLPRFYPWILWLLAILGALATVAVGRASTLYTAMEPRFNELSLALIPGIALLAWEVGKKGKGWRKFSNGFLILLAVQYLGKFSWDGFRKENQLRVYYRQQIEDYITLQKTGPLYPMMDGRFAISEASVEHLKQLKIHFVEEILRRY